ncbi:MAG: glycosyltransferase family 1 protein [Bacteroidetes bacterium]|nr:glycosyltransferase family 1 protein [Bacteroidota bacterium]
MLSNAINIISFDVPFPANYGGVIDVYYKLVWLKKEGVKIHLHCFTYGRPESKELEALCEKVYYYKRETGLLANFSSLPYTVKSRQSKELEKNLLSNDFPILFEVLHTCYLLNDKRFENRKKIYRHSNIEHDYYLELSRSERNIFKKIYLQIEAGKLKRFENIVNFADVILAVNQKDADYFKKNYPVPETFYLPSFHVNEKVTSKTGKGDFIFFHGNLSISENYEAAIWLIRNVFCKTKFPVIIAGLNPPAFLVDEIERYSNIELKNSPAEEEMDRLINEAQIHVLYTHQPTGLKLKLLNVLFKGRFIICNSSMIEGTGLNENSGFIISNNANEFIQNINSVFENEFSSDQTLEREKQVLHFNNAENCKKLVDVISL